MRSTSTSFWTIKEVFACTNLRQTNIKKKKKKEKFCVSLCPPLEFLTTKSTSWRQALRFLVLLTAHNTILLKASTNTYVSRSVMSNSLQPHELWPTSLLWPWNSPGKNTGVGCHALLQRISLTQGSNPGLLHHGQVLFCLSISFIVNTENFVDLNATISERSSSALFFLHL